MEPTCLACEYPVVAADGGCDGGFSEYNVTQRGRRLLNLIVRAGKKREQIVAEEDQSAEGLVVGAGTWRQKVESVDERLDLLQRGFEFCGCLPKETP